MEIPIPTLHLFPKLDKELLSVLNSLKTEDWNKPTLAKKWTVKDIATHLLDGNVRTLSMLRDGFFGDPPESIKSYQDLVDYLNRLNADWVKATKRLSPAVLIDLLETTGKQYADCLSNLDPFALAPFAVDWAGEAESLNWFHIAREYTEKWHHQQQIRLAVGQPGMMSREFYFPVLDTFMRALPHTYRNTVAREGSLVKVTVSGESGGDWWIIKVDSGWLLTTRPEKPPISEVFIEAEISWKLFTKGIDRVEAEKQIRFKGNPDLGKPVLLMVSVMA